MIYNWEDVIFDELWFKHLELYDLLHLTYKNGT